MRRDEWERALARAVVEDRFRARLLADPAETLADYGLAGREVTVLERLHPRSLPEIAMRLNRLERLGWAEAAT
jgi:hypothetical protein